MDSWGATIVTLLGGGALGTLVTHLTTYWLAKSKQPVDQYDGLVTKLQVIINTERQHFEDIIAQERAHCDSRITKLEQDAERFREREREHAERDNINAEKLGELKGRLDEQRRMLETVVRKTEESSAATAMASDQSR